mmetsp:Transcript_16512/g.25029  ORF Transcript_16512/g.25029 Transcript_16512/m.25029 type:complete len:90 (-) Transcript_16512:697-966(-)
MQHVFPHEASNKLAAHSTFALCERRSASCGSRATFSMTIITLAMVKTPMMVVPAIGESSPVWPDEEGGMKKEECATNVLTAKAAKAPRG